MLNTVCIFAGSRYGTRPEYTEVARKLGTELAKRQISLVFGAFRDGLMQEVADAVSEAGGSIIGVIPKGVFSADMTYTNVTTLHEVQNMSERKRIMGELADAFIALPGGLGTMEEFFEVFNSGQIKLHRKPIGLLNVANFYNPLLAFIEHAVAEGFVSEDHYPVAYEADPAALLDRLIAAHNTATPQSL